MNRRPFTSRVQVEQYLADDRLVCLECGRRYAFLPAHLTRTHDLSAAQYRERWGLPAGTPLAGRAYREQHSARVTSAIARGEFAPAHQRATTAAAGKRRGRRVAWERAEQAERMRQHAPAPTLATGATRADGRDAERARAYQRARRAMLRGDCTLMDQYRDAYRD